MAKLVAIDSMLFNWGIRESATTGQEEKIPRTLALFEQLDKQKYSIIIPAPVVSEGLCIVPPNEHGDVITKITDNMQVYPFDSLAAYKFAEMMYNYLKNSAYSELRKYVELNQIPKQRLKFDYMITAIAVVNGAECLYSNDKHIPKFAGNYIEVRELPNISLIPPAGQMSLLFGQPI